MPSFSGKSGLARKVAALSEESSVSTLACRFGDWGVSLSVEWTVFERDR